MPKNKKSTKKFVRKHLSDEFAKRKKRKQLSGHQKRAKSSVAVDGDENGTTQLPSNPPRKRVADLSVDELLDGSFAESSEVDEIEDELESEEDPLGDENEADNEELGPTTPEDDDISEDDEEGEEGSVKWHNQKMQSSVKKHKQELEALKQKDPEFYKFLEEHDKELLDFDTDEEEDGEREEEGGEQKEGEEEDEEEGEGEAGSKKSSAASNIGSSRDAVSVIPKGSLSSAMVASWCSAAKEKLSMAAMRHILRAFRSACHYGDGDGEDLSSSFNISSSHVFNAVMLFTLREADGIFRKLLAVGEEEGQAGAAPGTSKKKQKKEAERRRKEGKSVGASNPYVESPRWPKVEPLVKSYLGNALHMLGQLSDSDMIAFTLKRITHSVDLLQPFPKLTRRLLKVALHLWGSAEGVVSVLAALFLRQLCAVLSPDWRDTVLKGVYRTFAANARFITASNAGHLAFLSTCTAQMYAEHPGQAYSLAYVYIRQLAVLLRNALTTKTKDSYKSVYCWQYINCLELWVTVVSSHSATPGRELRPLVYPLSQLLLGTARLLPSSRYAPLRLHCARLMHSLAEASGTYIPLAPTLLDVMAMKELRKAPGGGGGGGGGGRGVSQQLSVANLVKVPKASLKTRGYQEECVDTCVWLLSRHLAQWSSSIAFPELSLLPALQLRRFVKECKVERFKRQVKHLVDQIESTAQLVLSERSRVTFSPKDVAAVGAFMEAQRGSPNSNPLVALAANLQEKAEQKRLHLVASSAMVGDFEGKPKKGKKRAREEGEAVVEGEEEVHGGDEEEAAFSKDWLPPKESPLLEKRNPSENSQEEEDSDVLEELSLSDSGASHESEGEEAVAQRGITHNANQQLGKLIPSHNVKRRMASRNTPNLKTRSTKEREQFRNGRS